MGLTRFHTGWRRGDVQEGFSCRRLLNEECECIHIRGGGILRYRLIRYIRALQWWWRWKLAVIAASTFRVHNSSTRLLRACGLTSRKLLTWLVFALPNRLYTTDSGRVHHSSTGIPTVIGMPPDIRSFFGGKPSSAVPQERHRKDVGHIVHFCTCQSLATSANMPLESMLRQYRWKYVATVAED